MSTSTSVATGMRLAPLTTDSLVEAFAATVRAHPSRTAIIDGEHRIDYATLDRLSDVFAARLVRTGVMRGDRVGLRLARSATFVVATLATLKCGAVCVPLDPDAPSQRNAAQAAAAGVRAQVIASGTHAPGDFRGPVLTAFATTADMPLEGRPLEGRPQESRPQEGMPSDTMPSGRTSAIAPDDVAYVLHTSGSTGTPKGVCLTHRGILDLFRGADYAPVAPGDVVHHGMSVAFDGALFELWLALLSGAALSILPPGASIATLCELIERNAVTTALFTTGLFNTFTDDTLRRLTGLRTLLVGGDVLAPGAAKRWLDLGGHTLVNGYGPTETTVFSHVHVVSSCDRHTLTGDAIPIGRPVANMSAYVLDDALRPVPIGTEGELYLGGSGVARGYLDAPTPTSERFLPDPFAGGEHRMYRSGDIVRQREDGTLDYLGRNDTQVKINGFRVEIGEIEHALCDADALVAACVVADRQSTGRTRLHAFVVRSAMSTVAPDDLPARLRERLPEYMVPRSVHVLDSLPLTLNGKIDRRALLALCTPDVAPATPRASTVSASALSASPSPITDGESHPSGVAISQAGSGAESGTDSDAETHALLSLLAGCLGIAQVAPDDNYYDIGGDSLAAMRFCALVEQTRGVDLPITALFEAETLREVVERIAATRSAIA